MVNYEDLCHYQNVSLITFWKMKKKYNSPEFDDSFKVTYTAKGQEAYYVEENLFKSR